MFGGQQQQSSGWGQPPQQPQQNTFGQPAQQSSFGQQPTFGQPATSTFGQPLQQTSTFGQPAQQTSGFGQSTSTFGQPATSTFGQPAQRTFGMSAPTTSTFGSLGTAQPATSGFGQPAAQSSFGSTLGGFGQPRPATGFGQTSTFSSTNAATSAAIPDVPPQGTASPAYVVTVERDTTSGTAAANSHYQAITCMPAYKGASFEELRLVDYMQNRRGPQQQPTFGQPASTFGQPAQGSSFGQPVSSFGQPATTSTFGQPATSTFGQPATSTFGQPTQNTFGQSSSTFGQPAQPQSTFGQPAATNTFGQPTTSTFGSSFGQAKPLAGSTFGQPSTQTNPLSSFGQPAQQPTTFGQAPTTTFGQPAATSTFGQPAGTSAFGQPSTQPTFGQPATTSTFGQSTFGQPAAGTGFGQQAQQPTGSSGFSLQPPTQGTTFGQPSTAPKSLFGQPVQNPQQPTTSAFGQSLGQQPQPSSTFGQTTAPLFGQQPQQQQQPLMGFGQQPQQQQQQQPGLGLFGQPNQQQQQQQQAQPTFGLNSFQQQPKPGGFSSSFGQPAQVTTFGASTTAPFAPAQGTGLFGNYQVQAPQPRVVQGSHFSQNPLFESVMNAPATTLSSSLPEKDNKKAPLLQSLRSSGFSSRSTPPMKLRPYGPSLTSPFSNLPRSGTPDSLGSSGGLSRSTRTSPHPILAGASESSRILSPSAFVTRPNAKKLMLDSFSDSPAVSPVTTPTKPKSLFDPNLEVQAASGAPVLPTAPSTPSRAAAGGKVAQPSTTPTTAAAENKNTAERAESVANMDEGGEYWTTPSMDVLTKLAYGELGNISNFVVGRQGYGKVRFLVPVDLTGFQNLRDIPGTYVLLEEKLCTVYPEEDDKPPEGEGLNVPAEITLEKCWPIDKSTQRPITDPSHEKWKKHTERLRNTPRTEFIDFTPDGHWVFRVEHFSRYGLFDDDDDEDDDSPPPPDVASHHTRSSAFEESDMDGEDAEHEDVPQASLMDQESEPEESDTREGSDEDDYEKLTEPAVEVSTVSPPPRAKQPAQTTGGRVLAQQLHLDPRRVQTMQASFFGASEPESAIPIPEHQARREMQLEQMRRDENIRRDLRDLEGGSDMEMEVLPELPYIEEPTIVKPLEKHVLTFASPSVMKGKEGGIPDAGLFLGRSFRASWGPNGQLVHLGQLGRLASPELVEDRLDIVKITKPVFFADEEETETEQSQRLLNVQLNNMRLEFDEDGIPYALPSGELQFKDFADLFSPEDHSNEALIWRLAVALWDFIDIDVLGADGDKDALILDLKRKDALSQWLEAASLLNVEAEMRNDITTEKAIFTLMTGHLIERACDWAMNVGDLRLATLLAQSSGAPGGKGSFRDFVHMQLENWREGHVDSQISSDYMKIYALLAGEVTQWKGNSTATDPVARSKDVTISKSLDWKRAFALHLWYGNGVDSPIRNALTSFRSLMRDTPSLVPSPVPWYREQTALASRLQKWNLSSSVVQNDALFELLQVASDNNHDAETALSPLAFSPSPSDYRLPWHLFLMLARVKRVLNVPSNVQPHGHDAHVVDPIADRITIQYAVQIEQLGMWEKAILVLLYLDTTASRQKGIRDVLLRNANKITEAKEEVIVEQLSIPREWVSEAKAVLAKYESRTYEEYQYLLEAGLQAEAHDIALHKLAPDAIIREDWKLLGTIFRAFDPHHVPNWSFGGKLILDYIEAQSLPDLLRAQALNMAADATEDMKLQRIKQSVGRLVASLPDVFPDRSNVLQNVCLGEMLAHLHQLASLLAQLGLNPQRPQLRPNLVEEASRLRILQDDTMDQFSRLVSSVA